MHIPKIFSNLFKDQFTAGSLFSGVGGFDLGFELAGMSIKWQVENDPYCQKILAKHWPRVARYGDIHNVGKRNLEPVNLIFGGFPCQPYSHAGKRRGTEDNRHLWPEMLRVITELQPTWIVGENVPGIIPLFLDQALFDLENQGYKTEQVVLPACAFNAPHRRDRLFIMAYSKHNTDSRPADRFSGKENSKAERIGEAYNPTRESSRTGSIRISGKGYENVAYAKRGNRGSRFSWWERSMGNAKRKNRFYPRGSSNGGRQWWEVEPGMGRMVDELPSRLDRLRTLGNAVVPQVAQHIGEIILQANEEMFK